jgi:hypothetical protein
MSTETGQEQADTVEAWRLHVLISAGYPLAEADLLAVDVRVDLHQAVYLLEAGCPSALAIKILT